MAGDIAIVNVDLAMEQYNTGPLAICSLNEMGIDKIYDPSKVLLVIDHTFPAADEKVANLHKLMRDFALKHNCMLVEGSISHQHILEYLAAPGMMINNKLVIARQAGDHRITMLRLIGNQ